MGTWDRVVNTLVVAFALFFVWIGLSFLFLPLTGTDKPIEGGATWDKAVIGVVFLLAAAPMFYYVFSKNAKGLPPPEKKAKPPARPEP